MQIDKIQRISNKIKELYNQMMPSADYDLENHVERVEKYDDLVDKMVELTKGEANSVFTDPVLCDDYTTLTGNPTNSLTYNELCESYGALTFGE